MKFEFKPADFVDKMGLCISGAEAAEQANAKLREWIEAAPKVLQKKFENVWHRPPSNREDNPNPKTYVRAGRLIEIEEIGK